MPPRSIVVLESNTGYTELHRMLVETGDRSKVCVLHSWLPGRAKCLWTGIQCFSAALSRVSRIYDLRHLGAMYNPGCVSHCCVQITPEEAQRALKDLIFSMWADDGCEAQADTLKFVSLVDFFLPFLPLERRHIEALFLMRLEETAAQLRQSQSIELTWDPDIITFLTDKARSSSPRGLNALLSCAVPANFRLNLESIHYRTQVEFDGAHPIEGAKEVSTVMTRHVSRALRVWSVRQRLNSSEGHHAATAAWKQRIARLAANLPAATAMVGSGMPPARAAYDAVELRVDPDGRMLRAWHRGVKGTAG